MEETKESASSRPTLFRHNFSTLFIWHFLVVAVILTYLLHFAYFTPIKAFTPMATLRSLTKRQITLLIILVVVVATSHLAVRNPRQVLMLFPAGQHLAQMDTLLDMEDALNAFKRSGANLDILSPKTPLPVVFEIVRPYLNHKSPLLLLNAAEYQDLIKSLKASGSGLEYVFCRYKTAQYPDPTLH